MGLKFFRDISKCIYNQSGCLMKPHSNGSKTLRSNLKFKEQSYEFFNGKDYIMTALKTLISSLLLMLASSAIQAANGITTGQELQRQAEQETTVISTSGLKSMLDEELDMVLIDIRTHREVENMGGTIDAPQNNIIPRGWIEFRAPRVALSKDTPIVVYCGAGIRSPLVAKTLQDMGYTNVKNYSAGFMGWKNAGMPIK